MVIIAVLGDPEGQAELEADPRVAELPAAQNGSLFYFDATMAGAINPVSPASLRWWLDEFVPQLEASPLNDLDEE